MLQGAIMSHDKIASTISFWVLLLQCKVYEISIRCETDFVWIEDISQFVGICSILNTFRIEKQNIHLSGWLGILSIP